MAVDLPAGLTPELVALAQQQLFQHVEAPFWLQKMAELGFPAEDEDTAKELLAVGMQVARLPDDHPLLNLGAQVLTKYSAYASSPLQNLIRSAQTSLVNQQTVSNVSAASSPSPTPAPADTLTKAAEVSRYVPPLRDAALVVRAAAELAAAQAMS